MKLYKHFERFHDKLRQVDRGIKRCGLKDSDEYIRKRNKVMGNEVEMHGDGYRQTEMESESEMTDDDRQSNEDYDSQSEGSVDKSEGWENQSEMADDESGENDQTGCGHEQTEMESESEKLMLKMIIVTMKVNLIMEVQNFLNVVEQKCGIGLSIRQMVKMKNLKVEMTNLKHLMNLTHNLKWLIWKRRMYMGKIKYGRQFKSSNI